MNNPDTSSIASALLGNNFIQQSTEGMKNGIWPYSEQAFRDALTLKTEQEKTKQEYYRLELRLKSLEMLKLAVDSNIPTSFIPILFGGTENVTRETATPQAHPRDGPSPYRFPPASGAPSAPQHQRNVSLPSQLSASFMNLGMNVNTNPHTAQSISRNNSGTNSKPHSRNHSRNHSRTASPLRPPQPSNQQKRSIPHDPPSPSSMSSSMQLLQFHQWQPNTLNSNSHPKSDVSLQRTSSKRQRSAERSDPSSSTPESTASKHSNGNTNPTTQPPVSNSNSNPSSTSNPNPNSNVNSNLVRSPSTRSNIGAAIRRKFGHNRTPSEASITFMKQNNNKTFYQLNQDDKSNIKGNNNNVETSNSKSNINKNEIENVNNQNDETKRGKLTEITNFTNITNLNNGSSTLSTTTNSIPNESIGSNSIKRLKSPLLLANSNSNPNNLYSNQNHQNQNQNQNDESANENANENENKNENSINLKETNYKIDNNSIHSHSPIRRRLPPLLTFGSRRK